MQIAYADSTTAPITKKNEDKNQPETEQRLTEPQKIKEQKNEPPSTTQKADDDYVSLLKSYPLNQNLNAKTKIQILADKVELFSEKSEINYIGNIQATKDSLLLLSDKATSFAEHGEIYKILLESDENNFVYIREYNKKKQTWIYVRAKKIEYFIHDDIFIFQGQVILKEISTDKDTNKDTLINEISAAIISYFPKKNLFQAQGVPEKRVEIFIDSQTLKKEKNKIK